MNDDKTRPHWNKMEWNEMGKKGLTEEESRSHILEIRQIVRKFGERGGVQVRRKGYDPHCVSVR